MFTKTRTVAVIVAVGSLLLAACGTSTSGQPDPNVVLQTGQSAVFNQPLPVEFKQIDNGVVRTATVKKQVNVVESFQTPTLSAPEYPVNAYPESLNFVTESNTPDQTDDNTSAVTIGAAPGNTLQIVHLNVDGSIGESTDGTPDPAGVNETIEISGTRYPLPTMATGDHYVVISTPENQTPNLRMQEIDNVTQLINLNTGEKKDGYPLAYYLPGFTNEGELAGRVEAQGDNSYSIPVQFQDQKSRHINGEWRLVTTWGAKETITAAIPQIDVTYWLGRNAPFTPHAATPQSVFIIPRTETTITGANDAKSVPVKNITLKTNDGKTYPAKTLNGNATDNLIGNTKNEPDSESFYFETPATITSGTITITLPNTTSEKSEFIDKDGLKVKILKPQTLTYTFTLPK